MRFGIGVDLPGDGTATGDIAMTLTGVAGGAARDIVIEGVAAAGTTDPALGISTISGTCTLDPGDGTAPRTALPFSMTLTTGATGQSSIALVLGTASLPAAQVTKGAVRVQ